MECWNAGFRTIHHSITPVYAIVIWRLIVKRILSIVFGVTIGLVVARYGYSGQAGFDEKSVANFYRGKTVTIVVGHSPGGGFDRYAGRSRAIWANIFPAIRRSW